MGMGGGINMGDETGVVGDATESEDDTGVEDDTGGGLSVGAALGMEEGRSPARALPPPAARPCALARVGGSAASLLFPASMMLFATSTLLFSGGRGASNRRSAEWRGSVASASSYVRPMSRLAENSTPGSSGEQVPTTSTRSAARASAPVRTSAVQGTAAALSSHAQVANATPAGRTTDRSVWITCGRPSTTTAIAEVVVPRSMPTANPIGSASPSPPAGVRPCIRAIARGGEPRGWSGQWVMRRPAQRPGSSRRRRPAAPIVETRYESGRCEETPPRRRTVCRPLRHAGGHPAPPTCAASPRSCSTCKSLPAGTTRRAVQCRRRGRRSARHRASGAAGPTSTRTWWSAAAACGWVLRSCTCGATI